MRFSLLNSALFLGAVASLALAAEGSDVIDLTADNFDAEVQGDLVLVEFFAPWCGHCKALAPHYEESATALKDKGIKLAKVDCVDQSELCQKHEIGGYPTLKVFRKGVPNEYSGPRKADGIISYMTKQSLPAVSVVTSANHEEIKVADKVVVIAYLASTTDVPAPIFSAVAEKHRDDYLFGLSTDAEVASAAGVTAPAIVLYKKFDEGRNNYPAGPVEQVELVSFIKTNAVPLVDEVSGENYQFYSESGKPLAYLFLDPTQETRDAHIEDLKKVAAKHRGTINFVWIDALKFGEHAKSLNLREVKWPSFVIQEVESQLKYPLDQTVDVTPESIGDFVGKYAAGKLAPELKSEPIPETQDESVFTLVSKQFEEVVYDDKKDVFVEFYAPWCGHCKRLKPTWDSLGDKYASLKDKIVVAKMDATENDIPPSAPFRVSGFPTIKFKPAGTRDFIDYEGDRSLESLIEFVQANAKNSLVVPAVVEEPAEASPKVPEPDAAQAKFEQTTVPGATETARAAAAETTTVEHVEL